MRCLVRVILAVTCAASMVASAWAEEAALTNADVVKLSKLGIGDTAVMAKIRQAPSVKFNLETDALGSLKAAGVSGPVIAAMLDRAAADSGAGTSGFSGQSVKEPDYLGNFCWRDPKTGDLTPLERQTGTSRIEVRAMGFGGGEGFMEIAGERSPIRFGEGQPLDFVVLVASQNDDPQRLFQLFALDSTDGTRRLSIAKAGSMGLTSRSSMSDSQIPLKAVRFGKSSFLLSPVDSLVPGEYALAGPAEGVGFCFGIDPTPGYGNSRLQRVIPIKIRETIDLNITERRISIDTIEVTGWPKESAILKAANEPDAEAKFVVVFTYSNRDERDWKCEYSVTVLDDAGQEIGEGSRKVSLDEGEIGDSHRVGVTLRMADLARATKLRVRVSPQPN